MDSKTFYKISYGLYVISSKLGDKFNGQIGPSLLPLFTDQTVLFFWGRTL